MMKRNLKITWVDEAASTNTSLAFMSDVDDATILAARSQTAGRGQRGNSWEAEPGKNLTFSLLLRPEGVRAAEQFVISQIVALAIADTLDEELTPIGTSSEIKIKWPNDIYFRDSKICGILIENILSGMDISQTIIGIGLNVNQEKFLSDAPNPISMKQISGHNHDLEKTLQSIGERILARLELYEDMPKKYSSIFAEEYFSRVWRADGKLHPFIDKRDPENEPEKIMARIRHIAQMGHLTIETESGECRTYAFKEVAHVLGNLSIG